MQCPGFRQFLAHLDRASAVALGVETRGVDADSQLTGQNRQDAPRYAAFGRHANLINPAAGEVVHSAGSHDAQHVLDMLAVDRPHPCHRIDSLVGERGPHEGQIRTGDRDGALTEIGVYNIVRLLDQDVKVTKKVPDGAVAVTRAMLRLVHVAVDLHRMPGVTGEHLEDSFDPCLGRLSHNLAGGGDSPGVDHGIQRTAGRLVEANGIEGVAARLDPDLLQHGIRAMVIESQSVNKRLGD